MIVPFVRRAGRWLLPLLLMIPAACERPEVETRPTIPLVREILAVKTSPRAQMLHALEPRPLFDIALVGPESACERLAEQLVFRDSQDNVDAHFDGDGLPDFAGETFVCLEDTVSYAAILARDGEEALRTQTVLRVLAALDTLVHISLYDLEGLSTKQRSKLVVLVDPYLAEYGGFDVDTLLRSTGCHVPVVNPFELMLDQAFQETGRNDITVGVLCNPEYAASGIYEQIFARKAAEAGLTGASCVVGGVERRDSVLFTFLHDYRESGHEKPLDVILVDLFSLQQDELKMELAEIVSVMNESSMTYGRLISREFFFLNSYEQTSGFCYDFLRRYNLFTHNIAYPQVSVFRTVEHPDAENASIFVIPGSYVQN